jgi:hypothetical protein
MTTYSDPTSDLTADPIQHRRTVLVAVLNNAEDMRHAAAEGWYRIPQRTAPPRVGADYLAFYQTGAFGEEPEAQTITYYAATRRYRLLTRRELLPDEGDHPRAQDFYFRIEFGPLQRLTTPIPSATLKRVTFIHTTFERLTQASDVRDLFITAADDPFHRLWDALKANRLRPLKNRLVDEQPVDITLRARGGYLGIVCGEPPAVATQERRPRIDRWEMLWLPTRRIDNDLDGCLRQIGASLITLGGSVLNQPQPATE